MSLAAEIARPETSLAWRKCEGDMWCLFLKVNLDHERLRNLEGVYVIWHGGRNPATVYVGQGNVAERLRGHRDDIRVLRHAHKDLFVTWAPVDGEIADGVERFLAEHLQPIVDERRPDRAPVPVNFPW